MKIISKINPAITERQKVRLSKSKLDCQRAHPNYQLKGGCAAHILHASFSATLNSLGNIPHKEQHKKHPC